MRRKSRRRNESIVAANKGTLFAEAMLSNSAPMEAESRLTQNTGGAFGSALNAQGTFAPREGVEVSGINGATERPGSSGEISPGKNPALEKASVVHYVSQIADSWRRCLLVTMEVAHLCAEANARLTATQKSELIAHLPFRRATFSKLVQIGTDKRLDTPEILRLLPPHYTTMYAVALLKDDELKQAVADKVLHPDLKRDELQRWRKSHRGLKSSDSAIASSQTALTQETVEGGGFSSTVSEDEVRDEIGDDQSVVSDERADESARAETAKAEASDAVAAQANTDDSKSAKALNEFKVSCKHWLPKLNVKHRAEANKFVADFPGKIR